MRSKSGAKDNDPETGDSAGGSTSQDGAGAEDGGDEQGDGGGEKPREKVTLASFRQRVDMWT